MNPIRKILAIPFLILALAWFPGWPGCILWVGVSFSSMTASKMPQDRLSKFLMWLSAPNFWMLTIAGKVQGK